MPIGWTPDSKAVLFYSNRSGNYDIYRQRLDADDAEALVTGPERQTLAKMTAEGTSLVYVAGMPGSERRVMRLPLAGGHAQLLHTGLVTGMTCGPGRVRSDGGS